MALYDECSGAEEKSARQRAIVLYRKLDQDGSGTISYAENKHRDECKYCTRTALQMRPTLITLRVEFISFVTSYFL